RAGFSIHQPDRDASLRIVESIAFKIRAGRSVAHEPKRLEVCDPFEEGLHDSHVRRSGIEIAVGGLNDLPPFAFESLESDRPGVQSNFQRSDMGRREVHEPALTKRFLSFEPDVERLRWHQEDSRSGFEP